MPLTSGTRLGPYEVTIKIGQGGMGEDYNTFDVENSAGWTPLRIAQGFFRTATFKEAPHTAALLSELMAAREGQLQQ